MKRIDEGNLNVVRIINVKNIGDEEYRLSGFAYFFSENGINIAVNTITGEIFSLNDNEYAAMIEMKDSFHGKSYILENGLNDLVFSRIIVENNYNEITKYLNTLEILKIMSKGRKGLSSYTILPTTACNARCIYCFEKNFKPQSMSAETVSKVIDYIAETKANKEIGITWFGGEPLVGERIISQICSGLKEKNISFHSGMISNGVIFDEKIINEAVYDWNLKKIQISMDGEKTDYEYRKQYIDPKKDNYDKLIRCIELLSQNDLKITLRINYDKNNINGLNELIDDLSMHFSGKKNIDLYFHILYQSKDDDNYIKLIRSIDEKYDYARDKGLNVKMKTRRNIKVNHCLADNIDRCVTIYPDGKLYSCRDQAPEDTTWGNIFDGVTDRSKYEKLKAVKPIEKECEHCCFLPICTPFYKVGCPNSNKNCFVEQKCAVDRYLRSLISDLREKGEL